MIFFYLAIVVFCVVLGIILFYQHTQATSIQEVKLYLNVLIENQAKAIDNEERIILILEAMTDEPFYEPEPAKAS